MKDSEFWKDFNEFKILHPEAEMESKVPALIIGMRLNRLNVMILPKESVTYYPGPVRYGKCEKQ